MAPDDRAARRHHGGHRLAHGGAAQLEAQRHAVFRKPDDHALDGHVADGEARLVVRRETDEDLVRLDQ